MLKEILNWTDEKFEKISEDPEEKHPYVKAFGLGAVEGLLDGLVVGGAMLIGLGVIAACKNKKDMK